MFADFAHLGFHTSCVPLEIRGSTAARRNSPSTAVAVGSDLLSCNGQPSILLVVFWHHVLYVEMPLMISVLPFHDSDLDCANFFHGPLRAEILFADKEHHA